MKSERLLQQKINTVQGKIDVYKKQQLEYKNDTMANCFLIVYTLTTGPTEKYIKIMANMIKNIKLN